ncbi:beta-propeller domain-containing protein [Erythrobacter alti]|uniref:beta-propeller domain-containing protein n=1 Tax=Erythrobacter alti TaxID=1896145 RepID=UPI0030F415F2
MKLPVRAPIPIIAKGLAACLTLMACQSATGQQVASSTSSASEDVGLYSFEDEEAFEAFAEQMLAVSGARNRNYGSGGDVITVTANSTNAPPPPPPPAAVAAPQAEFGFMQAMESADASAPGGEQITNTQEAGVDEGAIVKDAGDYLVILRRGRVFTVRHGGNALEPVDAINAFPPDARNADSTWYDEMLVNGDQVIVVGYSYGDFGTEINRFRLGRDGSLTYRDTHYLRSGDYYSSSNYASRMIGDELIFYAPVSMRWNDWRATMPALRRGGPDGEVIDLLEPDDIYVTEPARRGKFVLPMAHAVTRCDLSAPELDCEATAVLGTWSRVFYVSPRAVYLWTGATRYEGGTADGQLFRLPLDGSRPGSVPVDGAPIDQFSFTEDRGDGVLRVVLRAEGNGEGMWGSEFSGGDLGLLTVPMAAFTDGSERIPQQAMRELPPVEGWRFHNRFVGDYLLYAAGDFGSEEDDRFIYAAPVNGRAAQRIDLQHGVTRFDVMGSDAIAIGPGSRNTLGFSAISLGAQARVEDVYMLPAASEGEVRSQAFFYRPDAGSPGGVSGTLGLPVTRQRANRGGEFLGDASAIFFLRRDNRAFTPAGHLDSRAKANRSDNCVASCVDWYGNARPIFLGDRIFALMGYELVEGRMDGREIDEVRRVSFTPRSRAQR